MREVIVSYCLWSKLKEIRIYLVDELKLSEVAAEARIKRMDDFVAGLSKPVDYSLCRFKRWRELGYRCAVFEKTWVFAYEVFQEGIIVRDIAHTATLVE